MTDIFHEVEEDVRRERYEKLWKAYGNYLVGFAALAVIAVAGWQAWQAYELNRREETSSRFVAAAAGLMAGNAAQAEAEFAALAAGAPGDYASLAKFRLAEAQIALGKRDEAIAALRELTNASNPALSAPARLELAWLIADGAPRAEVDALLAPLTGANSSWRFAAAEISAYLDLQSGNRQAAMNGFRSLAIDPGAPDGLRQRTGALAQFLAANEPAATGAGGDGQPNQESAP